MTLRYRPAAGLVIWHPAAPLLLVGLRRAHLPTSTGWQLPQGGLNEGEAPLAGALRELEEETGIKPEMLELVFILPHTTRYLWGAPMEKDGQIWDGQEHTWLQFQAKFTLLPNPRQAQDYEFDTLQWMPPAELLARCGGRAATYQKVFGQLAQPS